MVGLSWGYGINYGECWGVFEGLNRREAHLLQEYHAAIIQSGYVQYG